MGPGIRNQESEIRNQGIKNQDGYDRRGGMDR